MKISPEQIAEVKEVRKIAKGFKALLNNKHDSPSDLLNGTEYEDRVSILENKIELQTALDVYLWLFTPRHGNQPARVTERFRNDSM